MGIREIYCKGTRDRIGKSGRHKYEWLTSVAAWYVYAKREKENVKRIRLKMIEILAMKFNSGLSYKKYKRKAEKWLFFFLSF